jgi:imidazole glycerol-phosphate synthase subunit HisH
VTIAIINYDAGNVKSVQFSLQRLGVTPIITDNSEVLQSADKVIFPGVGQAAFAMNSLRNKNLVNVIKGLQQPVLGICLGMQLLCNHSDEGDVNCLGIMDLPVMKFPENVKVPCIGWNTLSDMNSSLFNGVENGEYCYFVHSYYVPDNPFAIAKTFYGSIAYSASLQKNNFYACQFHPEKSGSTGEKILKNFLTL